MATISPAENEVICFAKSAELCGNFSPVVTALAHFHPMRQPAQGTDGNTKFPVGTLLLLEVYFAAEHTSDALRPMRNILQGPWSLADSYQSTGPIVQSLSADSPGSHSPLTRGSGLIWLTHVTCRPHSLDFSLSLSIKRCATNLARKT